MQEEFEKKVQERVHTFGLQPSPQVWDDINAVLGKRKHRRIFIGWWILLGLIVAGGGILFYEKDNILRNELNQHPMPTVDTLQQNNFAKQAPAEGDAQKATRVDSQPNTAVIAPQPGTEAGQGVTTLQKSAGAGVKPNGMQAYTNSGALSVKATKNITIHNGSIASQATSAQVKPENSVKQGNNNPEQAINDTPIIPNSSATEITPATAQQPPVVENEKQAVQNQQPPKAVVTTETPPRPEPAGAGKKVTPKTIANRHQWFFTVGGGTTQTASPNTGDNGDKNVTANTAANLLALAAPAAYAYSLSKPATGWHATAGLAYQYKLSPHVRVTAGVQAAYLTNTQKTGSLVKNTFYVSADDNSGVAGVAAGRGTIQSSYYLASSRGDEYTVVNKAWQLQVPVNVSYIINPHAKTKLLVNAGASYAYTLSSAWLIPDSRYEKLYYNKTLLNNHIISWQAGLAVEFKNNITLGLQYQQSFTTFAKGYIPPKMHWQNISVNAAIPFTIKFKKGKK